MKVIKNMQKVNFKNDSKVEAFIRQRLKSGKTLSKLLLEYCNIDAGMKFTFLPNGVSDSSCLDFCSGGIFTFDLNAAITFDDKKGKAWKIIAVQTTEVKLIETITKYLNADPNRIMVVEDALALATDAFLLNKKTQYFFHNDEVYHKVESKDDHSFLQATVRRISFIPTSICVLGSTKGFDYLGEVGTQLPKSVLEILAKNTMQIIVGAYDGEGYIFWEK